MQWRSQGGGGALGAPAPPFALGRSSILCNISLAHLVSSDVPFVQLFNILPHCDKGHALFVTLWAGRILSACP